MQTIEKIKDLSLIIREIKAQKKSIGFVPTMGFLHDGHISLIKKARLASDVVVISIFVNPAQFGPKEDFNTYPRDIKRDTQLCIDADVDILFTPSVSEMYPEGHLTYINVERITDVMCGASRHGHFRGVATAVAKLFNIVRPDKAFFGQKDYQQAVVIKRMAADLNMDVEIVVLPTVRELDGLAMSSRNSYLNLEERKAAACLYRSLMKAEEMIKYGERKSGAVIAAMQDIIRSEGLARIDYINIRDAETLEDIETIDRRVVLALAVCIGKTRLIDNISIKNA
ncbi:MAG: pantoate--beta-alanine ligase [Nitrospirae bacterium]|nr:pantoate--beta-alanine ligase [Nitrospirota bacterium]